MHLSVSGRAQLTREGGKKKKKKKRKEKREGRLRTVMAGRYKFWGLEVNYLCTGFQTEWDKHQGFLGAVARQAWFVPADSIDSVV